MAAGGLLRSCSAAPVGEERTERASEREGRVSEQEAKLLRKHSETLSWNLSHPSGPLHQSRSDPASFTGVSAVPFKLKFIFSALHSRGRRRRLYL